MHSSVIYLQRARKSLVILCSLMYDRRNDMPTPAILKQLPEMMRTIHFKRLSILISTVSLLGLLCASILQESGHNTTSTSEADVAGKLTFQNERYDKKSGVCVCVCVWGGGGGSLII